MQSSASPPIRSAFPFRRRLLCHSAHAVRSCRRANGAGGLPDPALARSGEQAFALFYSHCHRPQRLTTAFAKATDPTAAEQEMAVFLDRHGSCPHDRHDAIAAYQRGLSGR